MNKTAPNPSAPQFSCGAFLSCRQSEARSPPRFPQFSCGAANPPDSARLSRSNKAVTPLIPPTSALYFNI